MIAIWKCRIFCLSLFAVEVVLSGCSSRSVVETETTGISAAPRKTGSTRSELSVRELDSLEVSRVQSFLSAYIGSWGKFDRALIAEFLGENLQVAWGEEALKNLSVTPPPSGARPKVLQAYRKVNVFFVKWDLSTSNVGRDLPWYTLREGGPRGFSIVDMSHDFEPVADEN